AERILPIESQDRFHRLLPRAHNMRAKAQRMEYVPHDLLRHGIVVRHQHMHPFEHRGEKLRDPAFARAEAEPGGENERAARSRLAFHPDLAAHHLDNTPNDAQSKARAPVLPGHRAVGLREWLEELRALLGGHADPG